MNFPELKELLERYAEAPNPESAEDDFDRVAQHAPAHAMSESVAEAFRSDQTPPFPNMLGQMFSRSNPNMRANMLNQLIAMAGPAVLSGILGRGGGSGMGGTMGGLGGMIGGLLTGGSGFGQGQIPQFTPEQAERVPSEAVEELAREAQQQNPTIIDRMSDFAAQNPELVKGLGGVAVGIALSHLLKQQRGGQL